MGVSRPESLGEAETTSLLDHALSQALLVAADAVQRVAEADDRDPDEVESSRQADQEAREAVDGLTQLFNLWTAEPFRRGVRASIRQPPRI